MGITKRDIKVLQQTSSQQFRLASAIGIGLAIMVFLVGAVNDIRLCHSFAAMAGLTFGQVFSTWIKGVPASQASLEIVLLATQRLQMALISLAVVAILAIALWTLLATANRSARILESLKGKRR
jgi:membrane protein implicated in regulation of membrane protease activity